MQLRQLYKTPNLTFYKADVSTSVQLPFVVEGISAGFPSPADDFLDINIDLNKHLIKNPSTTFYGKVRGDSMIDAGIHEDDLVAIKKTTQVKNGDLVVVRIEDEVTLKYFHQQDHLLELIPANKDFATIKIDLREQEAFVEGKSVGLIRTH